jgi:hypothetical protein
MVSRFMLSMSPAIQGVYRVARWALWSPFWLQVDQNGALLYNLPNLTEAQSLQKEKAAVKLRVNVIHSCSQSQLTHRVWRLERSVPEPQYVRLVLRAFRFERERRLVETNLPPLRQGLERLPFLWKIIYRDVNQSGQAVAGIDGNVLFKRLHVVKPGTAKECQRMSPNCSTQSM